MLNLAVFYTLPKLIPKISIRWWCVPLLPFKVVGISCAVWRGPIETPSLSDGHDDDRKLAIKNR